jgi:hypothetical protein
MNVRLRAGTPLVIAALLVGPFAAAQPQDERDIETLETAPPAVASPAKHNPTAAAPAVPLELPTRSASARGKSDLFSTHSWYKPPPPPPPRPQLPPPAPTAPPLPFAFMGSMRQGDTTIYFLARGERAYDVKVGDVLDNTYSLDGVSNGQLMFTYLPLKTSQGLQIGEGQ